MNIVISCVSEFVREKETNIDREIEWTESER